MRAFYEQTLWIAQDFLLMHPDLHHRLLVVCIRDASPQLDASHLVAKLGEHDRQKRPGGFFSLNYQNFHGFPPL